MKRQATTTAKSLFRLENITMLFRKMKPSGKKLQVSKELTAFVLAFLIATAVLMARFGSKGGPRSFLNCQTSNAPLVGGEVTTDYGQHLDNFYSHYPAVAIERPGCDAWTDSLFWELGDTPSPYFLDLLKRYMEFHRQQMAKVDWNAYLNDTFSIPSDVKFVVVSFAYGNGNNMISFISAMTMALLSKRVILAQGGIPIVDVFCEAIPGSRIDISEEVAGRIGENRMEWKDMLLMPKSQRPSHLSVHLNMYHDRPGEIDAVFFNPTGISRFEDTTFITVWANQFFLPGFFAHPNYAPVLKRMFPDNRPYTHLLKHILIPYNSEWKQVKDTVKELKKKPLVVGFQVRFFVTKFMDYLEGFLDSCLTILNDRHVLTKDNLTESSVFIASLYELGPIFEKYGAKAFQNTADKEQSTSAEQARSAVAEMYTLGYTDFIVTSGHSTFGYQATSLRKTIPWHMNVMGQGKDTCFEGSTTQPCFHYRTEWLWRMMGNRLENYGLTPCGDWDGPGASFVEPELN